MAIEIRLGRPVLTTRSTFPTPADMPRLAFAETPQLQLSSGVSRSRAHGDAQPTDDSRLVFLAFDRAGELD
jgi:hypothetical protein